MIIRVTQEVDWQCRKASTFAYSSSLSITVATDLLRGENDVVFRVIL